MNIVSRHGPVVDSGRAVAADSAGGRAEGIQGGARDPRSGSRADAVRRVRERVGRADLAGDSRADAMPLLGAVPDVPGAYLATGHNCWGMLNAPASGRAMAELLCDGASSSIDLSPFDPARLEPVRIDSAAD